MSEAVIPFENNLLIKDEITNQDFTIDEYLRLILGAECTSFLHWTNIGNETEIQDLDRSATGFVNIQRINDIGQINRFLSTANAKLKNGQYLIVAMETNEARKERVLNKFPKIVSYPYYLLDFILKRVFPKWKPTRSIYFYITKGRNRVLSLSEGLARLICCGFDIMDYKQIGYNTYIIGKKIKEPVHVSQEKDTYGILIRLDRIGKDGKHIMVYKLRTMHPYSEYLQGYIFKNNQLKLNGKFNNDFRLTTWGRILRKYWIDEVPMLINWLKREIKFVGVRPLSHQYYELYPEELRTKRNRVKPGLIPPYYADLPNGFEEILESERRYLDAYEKSPFTTDLRYFWKVIVNILFKGARSQ